VGFLDKAKSQLTKAVDQHGDKIAEGVDKAADAIDTKTGGKHTDKIAKGRTQAKDALDKLDGKNDDIR
jgi:hypothetical protein